MKLLFSLSILISIFSCSQQNGTSHTLTQQDSANIYKALMLKEATIVNKDTTPLTTETKYTFKSVFSPRLIIPFDDAKNLHKGYLRNPIKALVNSNGEKIRGFLITRSDIQTFSRAAINGARVYLGYDEINNEYRLMLVGMDNNEVNVTSSIIDDFFPCPDRCVNLSGDPAIVRSRLENDLNHNSTNETSKEVEYTDFGGVTKKIRYE